MTKPLLDPAAAVSPAPRARALETSGAPVRTGPADATPAAAPQPPAAQESALRSALSVVGTIGPPLTIATSLMIYFGWERSSRQARVMGLDVSLFGYTTQDYVLMSISTLFIPLMVLAAIGLAVLAMHRRIEVRLRVAEEHRRLRWAGRGSLTVGLLLAAAVVLVSLVREPGPWARLTLPLLLAFGTSVAAYGAWLADAARNLASPEHPRSPAQRALRSVLVSGLIGLALFWALSSYADIVGRGYAERMSRDLEHRPQVTAFSAAPLGIEAPGVTQTEIAGAAEDDGALRYRTSGLRLLTRSDGRMFLLHDGWTPQDGTVIVLPDDDAVRWQFSR